MKATEFRIAPNDSTLAHAAAYGQIKQLRGNTKKLFEDLQAMQGKTAVRDGVERMEKHFGKLILMRDVARLKGSRPKARWLVLDANVDGGSDMVAILVEVDKCGWSVRDLSIRLTSHAMARMMQRTTRTSNLQQSAQVLRYHVLSAIPAATRVPEKHTLTTVSGSGAMLWVAHDGGIRAATWLGVDSINDPKLAALCREAGTTKVGVHLTKPNGEMACPLPEIESVPLVGGITLTLKLPSG